jgi:HAE1 family hydrophobic/amphiphilic exporter-1
LTAAEAVTRSENALKQLLLSNREDESWSRPLVPTDSPAVTAGGFTLDESLRVALENRPELIQSAVQKEINKVDVLFFENQTRPQVDLVAGYTSTGLSGTPINNINPFASTTVALLDRVNLLSGLAGLPRVAPPPAGDLPDFLRGGQGKSFENLFTNDFRTFRFGVTLSFPFRNRTAEAQLGKSLAEGRKIDAQRQILEQTVEAEVRNAIQSLETTRKRIDTARASREAAEQQLESEQRRFGAGLSTTYLVLERQNALSEARGRELRALTDYNKALSELQRVMGTTLTAANVEVISKK